MSDPTTDSGELHANPKMAPCTPVGVDYFETAPILLRTSLTVDAPADRLFACLEDGDAWPKWAPAITRVEWTSPQPFEVGTTRTVYMVGAMVADEEFIAWEPGRRMAFCFVSATVPTESFAEDWLVESLEDGKSRVSWTMAMTPQGYSRFTLPLFAPLLKLGNRWMLGRLRKLVEAG